MLQKTKQDSWYFDKDITSGAIQIVSTMRAVMDSPDAESVKNVVYGYDLPI
jgi:hypothetical protein